MDKHRLGSLWVLLCLIQRLCAQTTVSQRGFTIDETPTVFAGLTRVRNVTDQDAPSSQTTITLETVATTQNVNTTIQEIPTTETAISLEPSTEPAIPLETTAGSSTTEVVGTSAQQDTLTSEVRTVSEPAHDMPVINQLDENTHIDSYQCLVSVDNKRLITVSTMYHLDGLVTGVTFVTFSISPQLTNQRVCRISLDDIAEEIRHFSGVVQLYLIFDCSRQLTFEIDNGNMTVLRQEESLLFLNIRRCVMDISGINKIGQLGRLDTILVQDTTISSSPDEAYTDVDLSTLRTVQFVNSLRAIPISVLPLHTHVFSNITKLGLHHVNFGNHSTTFLQNFPNLLSLSLISCGLHTPPDVLWRNTTGYLPLGISLKDEQIAKNVQTGINIPSNEIPRVLKLVYNKFKNLTAFQFEGHLHSLILNNNQIKNIDEAAFSGVTGVQSIHLSANYISYIPELTFQGLADLYFLDLGNNIISSIEPGLFANLPNLFILNLEANRLTAILPGSLSKIPNIINLNLGWNQLTSVDPGTMPVLSPYFKVLKLGMNPLQSVSSDLFTTNTLQLIDFTSTGLSLDDLFDSLTNISIDQLMYEKSGKPTIRLASNSIERFPSVVQLKDYTETDIAEAERIVAILNYFCIDLSGNYLECDCSVGVFLLAMAARHANFDPRQSGPVNLEWDTCYRGWVCGTPPAYKITPLALVDPHDLYCAQNMSCPTTCDCKLDVSSHLIVDCSQRQISQATFTWPENVTEIWLRDNSIVKLPWNFTEGLEMVATLDLSNNSLKVLPSSLLQELEGLRVLHIDHNNLTSLPLGINNSYLEAIRVSSNPFLCSCENKWIKEWILEKKSVIEDWQNVWCYTFNGTWQKFTETEDLTFGCPQATKTNESDLIILAILLSIVAVLIILAIYFRREIQACVFVWFKLKFCSTKVSSAKVFVVHSGDDSGWMEAKISTVLAAHSKCKSVITMREFEAGYTVKENILSHIQNSSVTILVVSKSFLKTDLCLEVVSLIAEVTEQHKCSVVITVRDNCRISDLKNTAVIGIKRHRSLIFSTNLLFTQLLLHAVFSVPQRPQKVRNEKEEIAETSLSGALEPVRLHHITDMAPRGQTETTEFKFDVSVVYHDNKRDWVSREIITPLKEVGYRVGTPDTEFIPGRDHADNIQDLLSQSNQLIYVMSKSFLKDEWSTFIFRMATDLNSRRQTNYLCVVMYEELDQEHLEIVDQDIQVYIKCHTCLTNDKALMEKLNTCLKPPVTLNL